MLTKPTTSSHRRLWTCGFSPVRRHALVAWWPMCARWSGHRPLPTGDDENGMARRVAAVAGSAVFFAPKGRCARPDRLSGLDVDLKPAPPCSVSWPGYLEHYNTGRPHCGIGLQTPLPGTAERGCTMPVVGSVERVDLFGGLIHEHRRAT
jgi:hypothetical protein